MQQNCNRINSVGPFDYLAHPLLTVLLVGLVTAVIFVVASPSGCNALAVLALKFRFGAFAVSILTHHLEFVTAVPAIVSKVTEPLFRHASVVSTLKVHVGIAFRAALWTLVGTVTAIIFTVAEQPFRNASIICVSRTTLPSSRTIPLSAHVRWFVAVITAVIVRVAHPQFGDALAVFTAKFCTRIASTIV